MTAPTMPADAAEIVRLAGNVSEIADEDLVRRVISRGSQRFPGRGRREPLWSYVSTQFALGSTYSHQLCQRFGFDPDLPVRPA